MLTDYQRTQFNDLVSLKNSILRDGLNETNIPQFIHLLSYDEGWHHVEQAALNAIYARVTLLFEDAFDE